MRLKDTKEILNKFAKYVIQQARTNLTREKKNVTKNMAAFLRDKLQILNFSLN